MHPTMPPSSDLIEAIGDLLPPLLRTLERITWVQRHLYPPLAPRLAEELAPSTDAVAGPLRAVEALVCQDELRFMRDRLVEVARQTLDLVADFVEAARSPGEPIGLYRALRRFARIQEALYPLAPALEPVSRWFLEPARRGDDVLVERLRAAALRDDETRRGVLHASNDRDVRGGFSLYVPEASDGPAPMPLVVALHGGHGHGRDFLWSWLREARGRGVLVLSPTSRDRTWSIMGSEDVDAAPVTIEGPLIENHKRFPRRANAGYMQVVDRANIRLRVWERGAGETLSCGTGACAAVVAGIRRGLLDPEVRVMTRGGPLTIGWEGDGRSVRMKGAATKVFEGEWEAPAP